MPAIPVRRPVPPVVSAVLYRLVVGLTVGTVAYLLIQVARVAAQASGLCTGCGADDPGVLGALGLGGSGAALGGDPEPPGKSRFDDWMDNLFGGRPEATVEGVEPPAPPPPAPPDPEAQRRAEENVRAMIDLYKRLIGTKGIVDMPAGSNGAALNDSLDRVFDPSAWMSDIGPPPDGSQADSGGDTRP